MFSRSSFAHGRASYLPEIIGENRGWTWRRRSISTAEKKHGATRPRSSCINPLLLLPPFLRQPAHLAHATFGRGAAFQGQLHQVGYVKRTFHP